MSQTHFSPTHTCYRKKQTRVCCPSCQVSYVLRYFRQHKEQYHVNGLWTCRNKTDIHMPVADTSDNANKNVHQSDGDDFHARVQKRLHNLIRFKHGENIPLVDNVDGDSEDEATEIWDGICMEDIDLDFGQIGSVPNEKGLQHTASPSFPSSSIVMWICLFFSSLQAIYQIPDIILGNILTFLKELFNVLSIYSDFCSLIAAVFPGSTYLLWKSLNYKRDNFIKYVICKSCYSIYEYADCIRVVEGKQVSATCSFIRFPHHTQVSRRQQCGETLLKTVTLKGGQSKLYPFKTFCYKPVSETLKCFVKTEGFQNKCELWRDRVIEAGVLADVYDGRIWKEFHTPEKGNFLCKEGNYALMINLDWFQPFEHVSYSVGVLYGIILNLPRSERFKIKNVMLIGVIPDMSGEPPISSFVQPLVDELKSAWSDGIPCVAYNNPNETQTFKLALVCVGCDIPASRKLCGFLGHGANLGCSRCKKLFPGQVGMKDYSGFERENWPVRTKQQLVTDVKFVSGAKTQTELANRERDVGCRHSPLIELTYFDPIRMTIIDPMHNLFLGTAKKVMRIWTEDDILTQQAFKEVQERVDSTRAASDIGGIPRKIASSFNGFTAEQWKNWTTVFSVFALKGLIPDRNLENWRKFVLACRIVCSKYITEMEIQNFDNLIIKFCKGFENLYGHLRVTPNMHLHCHLRECLRDYGPVYSFWLFSFERYNGHLGRFPTNNRSVEIQLMRRFMRNAFVSTIDMPVVFREQFGTLIGLHQENKQVTDMADGKVYNVMRLSKVTTTVENMGWADISVYSYQSSAPHVLSPSEHNNLKKSYESMYPGLISTNHIIPNSCKMCSCVQFGNQVYGSTKSRKKRSSLVMAYWNVEGGTILKADQSTVLTPGVVHKFVLHNLVVEGESKLHLFAKIQWLLSLSDDMKTYCGMPVEAWSYDLFEIEGPSSFMPIQRIFCRCVFAEGLVKNKKVIFVCPLPKAFNV